MEIYEICVHDMGGARRKKKSPNVAVDYGERGLALEIKKRVVFYYRKKRKVVTKSRRPCREPSEKNHVAFTA